MPAFLVNNLSPSERQSYSYSTREEPENPFEGDKDNRNSLDLSSSLKELKEFGAFRDFADEGKNTTLSTQHKMKQK